MFCWVKKLELLSTKWKIYKNLAMCSAHSTSIRNSFSVVNVWQRERGMEGRRSREYFLWIEFFGYVALFIAFRLNVCCNLLDIFHLILHSFARLSITVTWKISLLCLSFPTITDVMCTTLAFFVFFFSIFCCCCSFSSRLFHFDVFSIAPFIHKRMLSLFIVPLNWANAFGWDSFEQLYQILSSILAQKNAFQFTPSSIFFFFFLNFFSMLLNFISNNGIVNTPADDGNGMSPAHSTIYINTSQFQLRFSFEFRRRCVRVLFFISLLCQTNKTLFFSSMSSFKLIDSVHSKSNDIYN